MTGVLKADGGESAPQFVIEEYLNRNSGSQLSEKHDSSSEEEQEGVRTITGFRVRIIADSFGTLLIYKLQWILVVTAILSSHMLFALDNTIVANIQPVSSLTSVQ